MYKIKYCVGLKYCRILNDLSKSLVAIHTINGMPC